MTAVESYKQAFTETSDAFRKGWAEFRDDNQQHQEIESLANEFLHKISSKIDSLFSEFTPETTNGIVHPSRGQRIENPFIRELCNRWKYAAKRYQKSPEPIVQFLDSTLDSLRREYQIEMFAIDQQQIFQPEALEWSESQLAGLLGQFLALDTLLDELRDIRDRSKMIPESPDAVDGVIQADKQGNSKMGLIDAKTGLKPAIIAFHYILQRVYQLEETPEARPEMKVLAELLSMLPQNAQSIATTLSATWDKDTSELEDVSKSDYQMAGKWLRKLRIMPDGAFLDRENPSR
jgi:hypothetical protein